jgi:hypothetical protein
LKADADCAMVQEGINTAIQIASSVVAISPMPDWVKIGDGVARGVGQIIAGVPLKDWEYKGDDLIALEPSWDSDYEINDEIKTQTYGDQVKQNAKNQAVSLAFTGVNAGISIFKMILKYKQSSRTPGAHQGTGIPGMRCPSQSTGWCASMGGGIANQNVERQDAILDFVTDNSISIMNDLEDLMRITFTGDIQMGQREAC